MSKRFEVVVQRTLIAYAEDEQSAIVKVMQQFEHVALVSCTEVPSDDAVSPVTDNRVAPGA